MNWDQVKGNWKQLKGKAQQMWGDIADDDDDDIEGKREELAARMYAKYGRYYPKLDLSLPARVYRTSRYLHPHESDQEAMRGDWEKIGADFRVSISKAERETAAD